jgi:nitrile hydratase accessory protein
VTPTIDDASPTPASPPAAVMASSSNPSSTAGPAGTPGLPGDDGGPVFAEPWHAEAYALAETLAAQGAFSRSEWAAALGAANAAAQQAGDADLGDTYYEHWLAALESLCSAKGLVAPTTIDDRADTWRRAYLRTPHGLPVELSAGD